ncbi:MAG: hypothetical protein V1918_07330, partial [Planctomycetota bacterium]
GTPEKPPPGAAGPFFINLTALDMLSGYKEASFDALFRFGPMPAQLMNPLVGRYGIALETVRGEGTIMAASLGVSHGGRLNFPMDVTLEKVRVLKRPKGPAEPGALQPILLFFKNAVTPKDPLTIPEAAHLVGTITTPEIQFSKLAILMAVKEWSTLYLGKLQKDPLGTLLEGIPLPFPKGRKDEKTETPEATPSQPESGTGPEPQPERRGPIGDILDIFRGGAEDKKEGTAPSTGEETRSAGEKKRPLGDLLDILRRPRGEKEFSPSTLEFPAAP